MLLQSSHLGRLASRQYLLKSSSHVAKIGRSSLSSLSLSTISGPTSSGAPSILSSQRSQFDTLKHRSTPFQKSILTKQFSSDIPATVFKNPDNVQPKTPTSLTTEVADGILSTTAFLVEHGVVRQLLDAINKFEDENGSPKEKNIENFVQRWQRMMEVFIGAQVHILTALGYPANERGVQLYNQHLMQLMAQSTPESQEELRVKGRDAWRRVLTHAFGLTDSAKDVNIEEARNMMHKVSLKMIEPKTLEKIAQRCSSVPAPSTGDAARDAAVEMQTKHTIIQEVLVQDVYLGGSPSLVEECGFGEGELGYVKMQCAIANYQTDMLVAQYVGTSMARVFETAGIDIHKLAQQMQEAK